MNYILENSNTLYFITTDTEGNFTFVNDHFKKRFSFITDDFIGKNILDSIFTGDRDNYAKTIKQSLSNPSHSHFVELGTIDSTNDFIWTAWEFSAKSNNNNEIVGLNCVGYDITNTKKNEEYVAELTNKTELILQKSLTGYWDLNVVKRTAKTSDTFKKMLGYELEEFDFNLDSWMQLVVDEDLPIILNALKKHYESKGAEPINVEVRYKHKNGSHVWLICTGSVVEWAENNQPVRIVGVHVDITKRKQAEEIGAEKDKLLNTFINSTPDLFFLKDENLKYIIANNALQELYQLTEAEIIGKTDFDILPFEVAKICKEGDERPLKEGVKVVREERDVLGKIVQTYKFPVDLGNGNLGVGTYARDITEFKKIETEKLNYQNFLRSVMDSSNEIIYIIDTSYNIVDVNKKAITFERNRTHKDINIGDSIFAHLSTHLHSKYKAYYDLAFKGIFHTKEEILNFDSNNVFFETDFYPVYDLDELIKNIVISSKLNPESVMLREKLKKDINEKEAIANSFLLFEENERKKLAVELHDGIGQVLFAASMHFENSKSINDNEFHKGFQLLKSAKSELDQITNNETVFWSNETSLEQAISNYLARIDGINNVTFKYEIVKRKDLINLPENSKLNYFRILQATTQNAIKHSNATTVNIKIAVRVNFITTLIADNGIGFDKQNVIRGMGLSNIENRVKIMNGRIKIFSKKNRGTTIAFQIPMTNENYNNIIG